MDFVRRFYAGGDGVTASGHRNVSAIVPETSFVHLFEVDDLLEIAATTEVHARSMDATVMHVVAEEDGGDISHWIVGFFLGEDGRWQIARLLLEQDPGDVIVVGPDHLLFRKHVAFLHDGAPVFLKLLRDWPENVYPFALALLADKCKSLVNCFYLSAWSSGLDRERLYPRTRGWIYAEGMESFFLPNASARHLGKFGRWLLTNDLLIPLPQNNDLGDYGEFRLQNAARVYGAEIYKAGGTVYTMGDPQSRYSLWFSPDGLYGVGLVGCGRAWLIPAVMDGNTNKPTSFYALITNTGGLPGINSPLSLEAMGAYIGGGTHVIIDRMGELASAEEGTYAREALPILLQGSEMSYLDDAWGGAFSLCPGAPPVYGSLVASGGASFSVLRGASSPDGESSVEPVFSLSGSDEGVRRWVAPDLRGIEYVAPLLLSEDDISVFATDTSGGLARYDVPKVPAMRVAKVASREEEDHGDIGHVIVTGVSAQGKALAGGIPVFAAGNTGQLREEDVFREPFRLRSGPNASFIIPPNPTSFPSHPYFPVISWKTERSTTLNGHPFTERTIHVAFFNIDTLSWTQFAHVGEYIPPTGLLNGGTGTLDPSCDVLYDSDPVLDWGYEVDGAAIWGNTHCLTYRQRGSTAETWVGPMAPFRFEVPRPGVGTMSKTSPSQYIARRIDVFADAVSGDTGCVPYDGAALFGVLEIFFYRCRIALRVHSDALTDILRTWMTLGNTYPIVGTDFVERWFKYPDSNKIIYFVKSRNVAGDPMRVCAVVIEEDFANLDIPAIINMAHQH